MVWPLSCCQQLQVSEEIARGGWHRGRVLLAPARGTLGRAGQHRCQVKAARDGAILAGAGARLGAILQRNLPCQGGK